MLVVVEAERPRLTVTVGPRARCRHVRPSLPDEPAGRVVVVRERIDLVRTGDRRGDRTGVLELVVVVEGGRAQAKGHPVSLAHAFPLPCRPAGEPQDPGAFAGPQDEAQLAICHALVGHRRTVARARDDCRDDVVDEPGKRVDIRHEAATDRERPGVLVVEGGRGHCVDTSRVAHVMLGESEPPVTAEVGARRRVVMGEGAPRQVRMSHAVGDAAPSTPRFRRVGGT